MKLTLLLLAPLASYASNATTAAAAAGNGTATTAAAGGGGGGNGTAATTAAASKAPAASTAAATKAAAAATTSAATKAAAAATKAGNTTAAAATDKKVRVAIPAVKVSVDFTVVNTAALKTAAATAIYDGVKTVAASMKAGGSLFAKFDAQFGTTGLPGTGYDAARRLAAKETTNDFKYVVTVPAADHAATMTSLKTKAAAVTATTMGDAVKAAFTAKGNLGNVTVSFDPAGMAVSDPAPAGTTGATSGAAVVTGFAAMVFTGLYSLF